MLAALIYSARSRRTRKDTSLPARVLTALPATSRSYGTQTLAEMREALTNCRASDVDTLFVLGGDGTHRLALDAAIAAYGEAPLPRVRFLRGGTMNTVCNALGLPHAQPEELARIAVLGRAQEVQRPLLRVQSDTGVHHGFLFGTGVMYRFLEHYERSGDPTPLEGARTLGAVLAECIGLSSTAILARDAVAVTVGQGASRTYEAFTVGAATVDQIGLGFKPFHGAQAQSDAFRAMVLHGDAWRIPACLPAVLRGLPFPSHIATEHLCDQMRIEGVTTPLHFMIDGDLQPPSNSLAISLGPDLRLLV